MPFHGHTKIASIYRATIDEKDCNTSLKKKKKDLWLKYKEGTTRRQVGG